jgi:hypothetical protein
MFLFAYLVGCVASGPFAGWAYNLTALAFRVGLCLCVCVAADPPGMPTLAGAKHLLLYIHSGSDAVRLMYNKGCWCQNLLQLSRCFVEQLCRMVQDHPCSGLCLCVGLQQ